MEDGVRRRNVGGRVEASPASDRNTTETINGTDGGFLVLAKIAVCLVLVPVSLLVFADLLIHNGVKPEAFSLPSPPKLEGALTPNELLAQTEKLFEGELQGPESICVHNGDLYTGTADGKILHIYDGKIRLVTQLGKPPCGAFEDEPTCGRPLGMRFDADGFLIVADAYLGLYKVNITSGESEELFSSTTKVAGKEPKFLNDLDIAADGTIYISDSSTRWDRRHHPYAILENRPDGRLMKFDPSTREMSVIKDGIYLANGVQLSPAQDFILVCEGSRSRILKYHLTGPEKGTSTVFIENLPGLPDNIRASSTGGFWVGIAFHRSADKFSLLDAMGSWTALRRVVTKILSVQQITKVASKHYGLILELNQNGEIVRSLHDPQAKQIPSVSEVEDVDGQLYLGSFHADYIGKLRLHKK